MLALDSGRPQMMNLKDLLTLFIAFREQVVTRRTKFLLNKARDRAHILVGLAIAVANIDEIIRVIRTSPDPNTARDTLMSRDWPAKDVEAMITLIDDPRHRMASRRHRAAVDGAGQGHSRTAPAAPDRARPRGDFAKSSTSSRSRSPIISTSCARARACRPSSRPNLPR